MANRCEAPTRSFYAAAQMSAFTAVALNTTAGQVAQANAGDRIIGILERDCALGDEVAVRMLTAEGTHKITLNYAGAVGDKVYVAAAGKFASSGGGAAQFQLIAAGSGDGSVVEAFPIFESGSSLIGASVAAATVLTSLAAPTSFDQTVSIPANSLEAGDVLDIFAQVDTTAANSTDTFIYKILIGTTAVAVTATIDAVTGDTCILHARVQVRDAGAVGHIVAGALSYNGTGSSAAGAADIPSGSSLGSTAIDTTAAQTVAVQATHSVNNAGNQSTLQMLQVIRHRK